MNYTVLIVKLMWASPKHQLALIDMFEEKYNYQTEELYLDSNQGGKSSHRLPSSTFILTKELKK